MANKRLLLGTLGLSWSIIPELLGFTNSEHIKIFHSREDLANLAEKLDFIDEVWLIATTSTTDAIKNLRQWQALMGTAAPVIKIWIPTGVADIDSIEKVYAMRELVCRLALRATEEYGSENVVYCLAGGRKTMGSDLQEAAMLFGASQLLHLIETRKLPKELSWEATPKTFVTDFPKEYADVFLPVIVAENLARAEILDFRGEQGNKTVNSSRFPVDLAPVDDFFQVPCLNPELCNTIDNRRKRAKNLLFHYAASLSKETGTAPFTALQTLPPSVLNSLKTKIVGVSPKHETRDLRWLSGLPKADLHCHLGGMSSACDLIKIAQAMTRESKKYLSNLKEVIEEWRDLIEGGKIQQLRTSLLDNDEARFKNSFNKIASKISVPVWVLSVSLINLFDGDAAKLEELIFGEYKDDEKFCGIDIKGYEPLGDLQGSSLLQTETAIRMTCKLLLQKCREDNIHYIEVRCSPINYTRYGLTDIEVVRFIKEELSLGEPDVYASLIFIGSRHGKMSDCWKHVELAETILRVDALQASVPLVGFDLAGDEDFDAEHFVPAFRPLFKECLHITVHAGETRSAESIWKAVYTLNAERIGHGLKLIDNKKLLEHFLDRKISLEMCPSSNYQIVGFMDSYYPETSNKDIYPLKQYLEKGLQVTVNTDNPGISRTSLSKELLRAARLTPGGLNHLEILTLIHNGFKHAFIGYEQRRTLLLRAEQTLLEIIKKGIL